MYNKIKYTLVPENLLEDGLLESAVVLTELTVIESPVIIFDDSMDLGLDSIYEKEGIPSEDIKYIDKDDIEKAIRKYSNGYGNCIILNGFDISIDDIRDKYAPLAIECDIILAFNVLTNKREYTNFTVNIPTNVSNYSDEEWDSFINDIEDSFIESMKEDVQENKIAKAESTTAISLSDFLDILKDATSTEKAIKEDKITRISDDPFDIQEPVEMYSFENKDGYIEVGTVTSGNIVICDDKSTVEIPKSHIDFVIDTLEKLKYNK